VGALVAPLIATQFTSMTTQWRFYYLVSLGLATTSFAIISIVFRGKHENDLLPDLVEVGSVNEGLPSAATPNANAETLKKMNQIMRVKAVHMLAIWSFIYVGLEVNSGSISDSWLSCLFVIACSLSRSLSAGMFEQRRTDLTVKLILKDRRWIVTFIQELRIDSSNESAYHSAGYVSTGEAWRHLSASPWELIHCIAKKGSGRDLLL
jgi:hypothetical protein